MRDPYKILGIPRNAAADEIKQTYRRLVKEVHPDLHPGDPSMEQRFKDVAAAYALLGDSDKRQRFDRGLIDAEGRPVARGWRAWRKPGSPGTQERPRATGSASSGPGGSGGTTGTSGGTGGSGTRRTADGKPRSEDASGRGFFNDIFRRGPRISGKDVQYELTVPFVDAATGTHQRLTLTDGRTITVAIPSGAQTDQILRLKGQGTKGMGGGPPGDALVTLIVAPHSHFQRDGLNILLRLPITLKEAILGATVDTPTVHGRVALRIPPGTSSGRVLRLRGKGVEDRNTDATGDQLVTIDLVMPDPPDPALKALIEGWNPPERYNPRRDAGF